MIQNAIIEQNESSLVRESVKIGNLSRLMDQGSGVIISIYSLANHKDLEETFKVMKSIIDLKLSNKQTTLEVEKEKRRKSFICT